MKKKKEINTILGKNTEFEGSLSFRGAIRIDGYFKGDILARGTLIVGETAVLESNIHVSHIIIKGEIRGNIMADKRIDIYSPGRVFGNIHAPVVLIEEGVLFEGECIMSGTDDSRDGVITVIK